MKKSVNHVHLIDPPILFISKDTVCPPAHVGNQLAHQPWLESDLSAFASNEANATTLLGCATLSVLQNSPTPA